MPLRHYYNIQKVKYMSNITRKVSLFLILVFMLELCSCGLVVINYDKINAENNKPSETGSASISPEGTSEPDVTLDIVENDHSNKIKQNLSKIPSADYNNNVFKITSPDTSSLSPDGQLEFLSEAAMTRNNYISEKHNISLVASKVDMEVYYEEVNTAVKSGMYYSDLMMVPQEMISAFAAGNLILNMRSMPGLDFDAEFFNSDSVGAAAGGFDSYAIAGPASIYPFSLPAVFFNKELCSLSSENPYSLVKSGDWTWDKFFEISIYATDNEYHFSWGTTELDDAVYDAAFVSCGMNFIDSGIMKVPSLAFDADSSASAVEIIKKLYSDPNTIRVNSKAKDYFNEGNGFFYFERLSAMTELKGSKTEWGILPMPKISAETDYYSLTGGESLFFACPATVSTPDKSAVILMSLNAASDGIISDAYIGYIQYNFLRDNESANMLEYIINGTVYDFSYTFGTKYTSIADGTYNAVRNAAKTEESMAPIINRTKAALDRTLAISFGLSN